MDVLFDPLFDPAVWASLLTLTVLEIVLGVDNLVFLAIVADRLPTEQRKAGRRWGLAFALLTRLLLLFSIVWIMGLGKPFMTLFDHPISWRDVVLGAGGLFLVAKATLEIHGMVEDGAALGDGAAPRLSAAAGFGLVVVQIAILDVVFSLDSVITAVGLVQDVWIMATAILIAVAVMLVASEPLSAFVSRHPTVKMLALAFLVLIGTVLIAEAARFHIPRGYIYFAMAFAVAVEWLNLMVRRQRI